MNEIRRRLTPRSETFRHLFLLSGNQCAFPECTHPLIIEDGTYVGETCHICAAEDGGERFNKLQSNEECRAFENLVLLCHDHHVVTNDVELYPVQRMIEIKAQHEARFEQGLAAMMGSTSTGIQIIDSVVSLGGSGGTAPGAGGGGGGAIGQGAKGGDGGQGGEMKHGCFELSDDVVGLRVRVGKGGEGGEHGCGGQSGEDSIFEAVFRDGTNQELLRAKGGIGAASDCGQANVGFAVLANSAEIQDGMIFVLAGGWQRYIVDSVPQPCSFAVVFIAEPNQGQFGTIVVEVLNPKGEVVTTDHQAFDFMHGQVPCVIKALLVLDQLGVWTVVLSSNKQEIKRLPFDVIFRAQE